MDLSNLTPQNLAPVSTSNPGTTWTPLPAAKARAILLTNDNDTVIEFRRGAADTAGNIVPARSSRVIWGISDASDLQVRRKDQSNTAVTVNVEAYT